MGFSAAPMLSDRRAKLIGNHFEFVASRVDAAGIVVSLRRFKLRAQLGLPTPIFVARLPIEHLTRVAKATLDGETLVLHEGAVASPLCAALDCLHQIDGVHP